MIGVGTPHGDDAAGLAVAASLEGDGLGPEVEILRCPRPSAQLLDALDAGAAAVIVDATRCGLAPGTVHEPPREALAARAPHSSHGFGVSQTLALAEALGRLPARLAIVGVEAERLAGPGLSPAVARGVPDAAARVRRLVASFREETARA